MVWMYYVNQPGIEKCKKKEIWPVTFFWASTLCPLICSVHNRMWAGSAEIWLKRVANSTYMNSQSSFHWHKWGSVLDLQFNCLCTFCEQTEERTTRANKPVRMFKQQFQVRPFKNGSYILNINRVTMNAANFCTKHPPVPSTFNITTWWPQPSWVHHQMTLQECWFEETCPSGTY